MNLTTVPQNVIDYFIERSQITPRLTPQDLEVWKQFQNGLSDTILMTRFDVRLGNGKDPGPDASSEEAAMWNALTQWRVDVGLLAPNMLYLVELKPRAIPHLNGQLMQYDHALVNTPFDHPQVKLVGLTANGDYQVKQVADLNDLVVASMDDPDSMTKAFGQILWP